MPARTYLSEKDVKNEVKKLLTNHDWEWWCPPGNGYGTPGVADFNAISNGVFLAVETKFGSNKPTKNQIKWLRKINARGGFAFMVNEKNVDALGQWLTRFHAATVVVSNNQTVPSDDGRALLDLIATLTEMIPAEEALR